MSDKILQLYGVDPGVVDTGVVGLRLNVNGKMIRPSYSVITRDDETATELRRKVASLLIANPQSPTGGGEAQHSVFVEKYRERGTSYTEHGFMREATSEIGTIRDARLVDNTGSKQMVRPALLELLGIRRFPTTHHQDLQAAARILVYGMLKDTYLNAVLTQVVVDHLSGESWAVLQP